MSIITLILGLIIGFIVGMIVSAGGWRNALAKFGACAINAAKLASAATPSSVAQSGATKADETQNPAV